MRAPNRLAWFFVAFLAAFLPEKVKKRSSLESAAIHVISGIVEASLGVILFVFGFLDYMEYHNAVSTYIYMIKARVYTESQLRSLGLLGYLSYLLQPTTWLFLYCFAEGTLRALDAWLNGVSRGTIFLYVPYKVAEYVGGVSERRRRQFLLGPPRPDEVLEPTASPSTLLEIYSVEDKPWSEHQTLKYKDQFYVLTSKGFITRGKYWTYQYLFRELKRGEVIRGTVVEYPSLRLYDAGSHIPRREKI